MFVSVRVSPTPSHRRTTQAFRSARAETVETKQVFRDAFKRTRCLIPMSGYYEWQDTPSGKQPWYFTAADGSPLLTAAGLWDEWKDRSTGERRFCMGLMLILTSYLPSVPLLPKLTEGNRRNGS